MSFEYLPELEESDFFVYAMLCQDGDGPLYVKFGKTKRLGQRLTGLRTASPVPARYFALVQAGNSREQGDLEKGLHAEFSDRRTSGEWFRFDSRSQADKAEFNRGTQKQIAYHLGPGLKWKILSVAALDRYARQRQMMHLRSPGKAKRESSARNRFNQRRAHSELGQYGLKD